MARSPKNLGVRKGRTVRLFAGYRPSMPPSISTLRDECWPTCLGQTARCKTRVRPNAHWALAPVFVSSASTIPLRTSRPEILNHPFPQNESAAEVLRFPRGSVASRQGQHIRWAEGRRDPPYKSAQPPVHSSHPGSQFACRVLDPVQLLVHPGSPAPQQSAKHHQRQPVTQNLQDVRAASPWGPRSAVAEVQRLQSIPNDRAFTAFAICRTILARLPLCAASSEKCGGHPASIPSGSHSAPTGTSVARPVRVCQINPCCSKERFASNPQIPWKNRFSIQEGESGQWSRASWRLSAGTPRS